MRMYIKIMYLFSKDMNDSMKYLILFIVQTCNTDDFIMPIS